MKKLLTIILALSAVLVLGVNQATASGSISGSVLANVDDSPVAGAMIVVHNEMTFGQRQFQVRLQAGVDGKFEIADVPAGKYIIAAYAELLGGNVVHADVKDEAETDVVIKLGPLAHPPIQFGSLVGTVVDADGKAVASAKVILNATKEGYDRCRYITLITTTDASGSFSFAKVPAGVWIATAFAGRAGIAHDQVQITADQQSELKLTILNQREEHDKSGDHKRGGDWDRTRDR